MVGSTSTVPDVPDIASERRGRRIRTAALLLIALFVVVGAADRLGVRSGTESSASASGLRVRLIYPTVARPGLAVPYRLTIARAGGFAGAIEVRTSTSYLEMFDENGRNPEPAESTTDGDETVWTFDPPDGDRLVVWMDARIEPGVQWKREGTTLVAVGGERLELRQTTWLLP